MTEAVWTSVVSPQTVVDLELIFRLEQFRLHTRGSGKVAFSAGSS